MSSSTPSEVPSGLADVLTLDERGLYCPAADLYIDPHRATARAIVTHGHSDHARRGHGHYICAPSGEAILRARLGKKLHIETWDFGEQVACGDALVSLHPAGHILGSAQVRIELDGRVWVVTSDFKRAPDPSCEPFELVPCDVLVTEATFGMPIYRWPPADAVMDEIAAWWADNAARDLPSLLFCYSLGKAQRLLAELGPRDVGPIWVDDKIEDLNIAYRQAGIALDPTPTLSSAPPDESFAGALVLGAPQARRMQALAARAPAAFASGWMRVRSMRRARAAGREGFVLSDHADWPELLQTVEDTGATRVIVDHDPHGLLVPYLLSRGIEAAPLEALRPQISPVRRTPAEVS